jgi:hypothetical protein
MHVRNSELASWWSACPITDLRRGKSRWSVLFSGRELPPFRALGIPKNRMRAGTNFARKFNADSPVQSSGEKYFPFVFQKYMVVLRRPALTGRGGRVVTNVERGMRWTR